jgi:hypothetical protein
VRGDAAKALAWYENMPNFEICWNRRRFLEWRRDPENAPLVIEAILLERVLLDGRPQLEIVARLAAIDEDRSDEAPRVICSGVTQDANSASCAD